MLFFNNIHKRGIIVLNDALAYMPVTPANT